MLINVKCLHCVKSTYFEFQMTRDSNRRTIFKLCLCGKAGRFDNFRKQHAKLLKNEKDNHRVIDTKYCCISCNKIKYQKETLKDWHQSHEQCENIECTQEILDNLFRNEISLIREKEVNNAVNSILDEIPEARAVRTLSESSSSDSDVEEESSTETATENCSNVVDLPKCFKNVATQTDIVGQTSEPHPTVVNAKDELIKSNRRYKDENYELKAKIAELQKQVEEYTKKKAYLDQTLHDFKQLEINSVKLKSDVQQLNSEKNAMQVKLHNLEITNKKLESVKENINRELQDHKKREGRSIIHIPIRNDMVLAEVMVFGMEEPQFCYKEKRKGIKCIHLEIETTASRKLLSVRHVAPYRKKRE